MNGSKIFDALHELASLSGNEKLTLLGEHIKDSWNFQWVCHMAMNRFITFGVKKIPEVSSGKLDLFNERLDIEKLLIGLAERQLSGNDPKEENANYMQRIDSKSQEVLRRILLKDLKCGIGASSVNKFLPVHHKHYIPEFDVMRANEYKLEKIKEWPVAVEIKLDGVRLRAHCNLKDDEVLFLTREGHPFLSIEALKKPCLDLMKKAFPEAYMVKIDCEFTEGNFNESVSSARKKTEQAKNPTLTIFDLGVDDDWFKMPYLLRRSRIVRTFSSLQEMGKIGITASEFLKVEKVRVASSDEEIQRITQEFWDKGQEGSIIKSLTGLYEEKKSNAWLKLKKKETIDAVITAVLPGKKGSKYENSAGKVVFSLDGVEVRAAIATTDDERQYIWDNQSEVIGRVGEFEYHEMTPVGSLRHPRFKRFRSGVYSEAGKE